MSFEAALLEYLDEATWTTAGVSIYYGRAPDNASLPFILVSTEERTTHQVVGGSSQQKHQTFDFECYGDLALEAMTLGTELLARLEGPVKLTMGDYYLEKGTKVADYDEFEAVSGSYFRSITLVIGYR